MLQLIVIYLINVCGPFIITCTLGTTKNTVKIQLSQMTPYYQLYCYLCVGDYWRGVVSGKYYIRTLLTLATLVLTHG